MFQNLDLQSQNLELHLKCLISTFLRILVSVSSLLFSAVCKSFLRICLSVSCHSFPGVCKSFLRIFFFSSFLSFSAVCKSFLWICLSVSSHRCSAVLHTSRTWCPKRRKRLVRRENSVFLFQGVKMKIIARFTYFSKMVFKTS